MLSGGWDNWPQGWGVGLIISACKVDSIYVPFKWVSSENRDNTYIIIILIRRGRGCVMVAFKGKLDIFDFVDFWVWCMPKLGIGRN